MLCGALCYVMWMRYVALSCMAVLCGCCVAVLCGYVVWLCFFTVLCDCVMYVYVV